MPLRNILYIETQDKVKIVGDMVLPDEDIQGASLLLHMMPATRKSYEHFQDALAVCNIASFAIDLRGHGESVLQEGNDVALDYKKFTDADHQKSLLDVDSAYQYMCDLTHMSPQRTSVIGASIGANLAILFLTSHKDIPIAVALSPGMEYKGIRIKDSIHSLRFNNQRLILAASKGDMYSHDSVQEIHAEIPEQSVVYDQEDDAHGTDLFQHEDFAIKIISFLCKK